MAICKVAYNMAQNVYLRRTTKGWYTTNDCTAAYASSDENLRKAILEVGYLVPGKWEIMKAGDAQKQFPRRCSVQNIPLKLIAPDTKQKGASILGYTTPRTDTCNQILSAARTLSELVSDDSMKSLARRQAEADKLVTDMYHYIEVSNLNASQGYMAYRKLKEALITRRKIKNEYTIANKLRQSGMTDISRLEMLSERAWDPQTDLLTEVNPNE